MKHFTQEVMCIRTEDVSAIQKLRGSTFPLLFSLALVRRETWVQVSKPELASQALDLQVGWLLLQISLSRNHNASEHVAGEKSCLVGCIPLLPVMNVVLHFQTCFV